MVKPNEILMVYSKEYGTFGRATIPLNLDETYDELDWLEINEDQNNITINTWFIDYEQEEVVPLNNIFTIREDCLRNGVRFEDTSENKLANEGIKIFQHEYPLQGMVKLIDETKFQTLSNSTKERLKPIAEQ